MIVLIAFATIISFDICTHLEGRGLSDLCVSERERERERHRERGREKERERDTETSTLMLADYLHEIYVF